MSLIWTFNVNWFIVKVHIFWEGHKIFCEIFTLLLTVCTVVKKKGEDFAKICGLLRIHELYETDVKMQIPVSKLKNSNDQFPCAV